LQTALGFVGNSQFKKLIIKQPLQAFLEIPCAAAITGNFHDFIACLFIIKAVFHDFPLPIEKFDLGFLGLDLGLLGLVRFAKMDGQAAEFFPEFRFRQSCLFAFVHNLDGAAAPRLNHARFEKDVGQQLIAGAG